MPDYIYQDGRVNSLPNAQLSLVDVVRDQNILTHKVFEMDSKMNQLHIKMDQIVSMLQQLIDVGASSAPPKTPRSIDPDERLLKSKISTVAEMQKLETSLQSPDLMQQFVSIHCL